MIRLGIALVVIGILVLAIAILYILFWLHWIVGMIGIGVILAFIGGSMLDDSY